MDDQQIDEVVGNVVSDLEALNLGGHDSFKKREDHEGEWGGDARWMEIVRKRSEDQAVKRVEARA